MGCIRIIDIGLIRTHVLLRTGVNEVVPSCGAVVALPTYFDDEYLTKGCHSRNSVLTLNQGTRFKPWDGYFSLCWFYFLLVM